MANEQELNAEYNAIAAEHPEVTGEDAYELVEELADTATIEQLLDDFIQEVSDLFVDAVEVSLDGNPVRTHLELTNLAQDTVDLAHTLKRELLEKIANRAEVIAEQGSQLRKQVLDDEPSKRMPSGSAKDLL